MSEDEWFPKKRRVQRACDICRKKKMKCDGDHKSNTNCSYCEEYGHRCTYVEAIKKPPSKEHVEELEKKVQRLTTILQQFMTKAEIDKALASNSTGRQEAPRQVVEAPSTPDVSPDCSSVRDRFLADEFAQMHLASNIIQLSYERSESSFRYFGESAGIGLVKMASDLKNGYQGTGQENIAPFRRPAFWSLQPWELDALESEDSDPYTFPENDLLCDLIDLFFARNNVLLPLLHRPTFERYIAAGLHRTDAVFGGVVLLVCACASRSSEDSRVFLEEQGYSTLSSGWKWFVQVKLVHNSTMTTPGLHDLQLISLYAEYITGSSLPQTVWNIIGLGLRLAQDIGAHRRKTYKHQPPTVEDELWKRAFWRLYVMDRDGGATLGRTCAIIDEDIDVDFPTECDDEYWEHSDPDMAFKQPPETPSTCAYWISTIKLKQILSSCLRRMYSTAGHKISGTDSKYHQAIVSELDSALNAWVDSIPDHLRWDPNREDKIHLNQSATLYISYYYLQILTHRPFISTPGEKSPLSFPSLAICTNAARCSSHIVEVLVRRGWPCYLPANPVFACAVVLLLNIWGGQRSTSSLSPSKGMEDIQMIMKYFKVLEKRWHFAGRIWDALHGLASPAEFPLPRSMPEQSNKREREEARSNMYPSVDHHYSAHPSPHGEARSSSQYYPVHPESDEDLGRAHMRSSQHFDHGAGPTHEAHHAWYPQASTMPYQPHSTLSAARESAYRPDNYDAYSHDTPEMQEEGQSLGPTGMWANMHPGFQ